MTSIFVAIEVGLFVGAVVVAWLLTKKVERRSGALALGVIFAGASAVAMTVFAAASVNYRIPAAWIAGVVVSAGGIAALAFLYGRTVRWSIKPMLGLLALFAIGGLGFFAATYSSAGQDFARKMFVARATQMGEAFDFTPLMPADDDLVTDSQPISTLPGSDEGIAFVCHGYEVHERKAASKVDEKDLAKILAPGAEPMDGLDEVIPDDARITELEVSGEPAIAAEFTHQGGGGPKNELVSILVTVVDGVDVRVWSGGREELVDGDWKLYPAYTPDELAGIVEKMTPVE